MTDIKTKLCKTCNKVKPLSAFYLKQRDDYAHNCLTCRLAAATGQPIVASSVSQEYALLEISLLNAETSAKTFDDVVVEGVRNSIPLEVLTRMERLWDETKVIAGEVIEVGKIIIMKIMDFLKTYPNLTASLAIGAAVYLLMNAIPIIGPLLGTIFAAVSALTVLVRNSSFDELLELADSFFQLLVDVFNAVASRREST